MTISDEAVEAAVSAYLKEYNFNAEEIVQLVLAAAAPHLMAEAWDEGYETCLRDEEDSHWGPVVTRPNPYRSAGAGE